jgi:hypothetical protein
MGRIFPSRTSINWSVSSSAYIISGSGCAAGILSVQGVSSVVLDSRSESLHEGFRFRRIIRAALNTMRVNQVVNADRPSKARK